MNEKIRNYTVFLFTIALYYDENILIDDRFYMLFDSFLDNYYDEKTEKLFDLILYPNMYSEENQLMLALYSEQIKTTKKLSKLYDEIGIEKIDMISNLAYMFVNYVYEGKINTFVKIRS